MSEVELPILIRNPKVTRIEWTNTSPEFLSQLENIATRAKTRQEFQAMSAKFIESNKSTVFVRSKCRDDLTDANAVNAIRDTIIEKTGGKSLTSERIKKQMDSFDECKEAENKLIPLNKEYGILKGEEGRLSNLIDEFNQLNDEKEILSDKTKINDLFVAKNKANCELKCHNKNSKKTLSELKKTFDAAQKKYNYFNNAPPTRLNDINLRLEEIGAVEYLKKKLAEVSSQIQINWRKQNSYRQIINQYNFNLYNKKKSKLKKRKIRKNI